MADQTIEKTPMASTSVNQPASGTYGEKADEAALKADTTLPPMNQEGMGSATGGPAPMPEPSVGMPGAPGGAPLSGPPGVPSVLLGAEGPLPPNQVPANPMANPAAARIALLENLASSQEVSAVTRAWAQGVLKSLRG
jgi:hypothetical protein